MELLLFATALTTAVAVLFIRTGSRLRWIAAVCAAGGAGAVMTWAPDNDTALTAAVPGPVTGTSYVTSATCRSCHPQQHDSWHRSYHRSMTRTATPASVLGSFDDVTLKDRGHTYRLTRRGAEFWVETPDLLWFHETSPNKPTPPPRIQARIVMTTGSHHMQTYWIRRPATGNVYARHDDGTLLQFPFVWLIDEGRWVPTQDSFINPPNSNTAPGLPWNFSCHKCHSVGTQPHYENDRFETKSVELGIACEACHGPGEEHVRANRSPLHRYAQHLGKDADAGDPTIVNPARLDKVRSAEVCGQCHSFNKELDMERANKNGVAYRAGGELGKTRAVFRFSENPTQPALLEQLKHEPNALVGRFWSDGTMRVAGREYNGLIESPCYQRGEMTCLSCHSLHRYEQRKDQLAPDRQGDQSCLQCHAHLKADIAAHTHHGKDSAGSRCMNCHMPHTTYGLFVAMRSHRIDSPDAAVAAKTGRPNACNLCHLDQTLAWTSRHLQAWYGHRPAKLTESQSTIAVGIRHALKGDAAQRAIIAWHMGWEPALQASGRKWQAAFLSVLLSDPYSAVRRVAGRSIQRLPGFAGFEFDYVAPRKALDAASHGAGARWMRAMAGQPDRHGPHLLIDSDGRIDDPRYQRLLAQRDNRRLWIVE